MPEASFSAKAVCTIFFPMHFYNNDDIVSHPASLQGYIRYPHTPGPNGGVARQNMQ